MKRVLHIQGSPRDDGNSASYAKMFIKAYQAKNPKHYVETLNVWTDTFQFSQGHVSAKYDVLSGMVPGSVWNKVTEAITHFKSFDKYIVSCGVSVSQRKKTISLTDDFFRCGTFRYHTC